MYNLSNYNDAKEKLNIELQNIVEYLNQIFDELQEAGISFINDNENDCSDIQFEVTENDKIIILNI